MTPAMQVLREEGVSVVQTPFLSEPQSGHARVITGSESTNNRQLEHLTIIVYGDPAPQGSKRFVGMRGGKGVMVESSKKVKPWRNDVAEAARAAIGDLPKFDGPLSVRMVFTMPKPVSSPKRRRSWACKKPDLSKLIRSTEDALTTAGVWADDSRVVEYARAAKVYPGEDREALQHTGCVIVISRVEA